MEHTVPARDEVNMELVWNPQIDVACKETLQLLDNRNFRKEVMIILKSKSIQPARVSLHTYMLINVHIFIPCFVLFLLPEVYSQISHSWKDAAA